MTGPRVELMTPAPEISVPPGFEPTGNLQVHLSGNRTRDAAVERVGVVHMGVDGVLDLVGAEERPLLAPDLTVAGERLLPTDVTYLGHWVPVWHYRGAGCQARLTLLAPVGERGFAIHLAAEPSPSTTVEFRLEGVLGGLEAVRFSSQPICVPLRRYRDAWTGTVVWDSLSPRPLVAMAAAFDGPWVIEEGGALSWTARCTLSPSEVGTKEATVYFGVAPEGDGARTTALHLRRVGWPELLRRSCAWLEARAQPAPMGCDRIANRNLFFSYFLAQADALDTGTPVMLTSRSFVYYVSGAYWSRDALLWALPAVQRIDPARARKLLQVAFARYARHPGEHAQYLGGEILYPGFELDEAAAYPLALARYTKETGDNSLARCPEVTEALRHVLEAIKGHGHAERELYRTFLSPSDDPVGDMPYLAYDNFLLAAALIELGGVLGDAALASWGDGVRREAMAFFRHPGPYGEMYAFAGDEHGALRLDDNPGGSLLLLPSLGVCAFDDPVWRASARWIRSHHNPHHYVGRFPGRGSAHFPNPSVFGLVNDLLSGHHREALMILREAPLDNGIACESFHQETGVVASGGAFASLAGWLAHALIESHGVEPADSETARSEP